MAKYYRPYQVTTNETDSDLFFVEDVNTGRVVGEHSNFHLASGLAQRLNDAFSQFVDLGGKVHP